MKPFKFRLATLLRLREATRDERRAQLADALRTEQALVEQLDRLDAELKQMKAQQTASAGRVDVDRLLDAHRYETVLRIEYAQISAQRMAVQTEIERRRAALVEADRDVRVLEKLRATQNERHLAEEERRAMKVLDEVAQRSALAEGAV